MSEQFPLYKFLQVISKWWGQNIFSSPEKKYEKLYIIFFLILLGAIHLVTLVWRLNIVTTWIVSLFNLTFVTLFICNLFSLYTLNFSQRANLTKLFKNINTLYKDLIIHFPGFKMEEEKQFNIYFMGGHILFLLYFIFQYFSYVHLNFPVYQATPLLIFYYLVMLTVFQYSCIIFIIKNLLDNLNKRLYEYRNVVVNLNNIRNHTSIRSNVKFLLKSYDKVLEIAFEVNKIFGIVLLGLYLILLVSLIRTVTMIVHFGIFKWRGSEVYSLTNISGCLSWLVS